MALILRCWRWLVALIWAPPIPPVVACPISTQETAEKPASLDRGLPSKKDEPSFAWMFRRDVLERLDEYFFCFRKLQLHDPQSYGLFAQTGLAVPAGWYANPEDRSFTVDPNTAPSHGGILGPANDEKGRITPSFVYFQKLRQPPRVQAAALVYRLTAVFDNRRRGSRWYSQLTAPVACYLAIEPSGTFRLLKEEHTQRNAFHVRSHKGSHRSRIETTARSWRYPQWVLECGEEHAESGQEWAVNLLRLCLFTYLGVVKRVVVRVKHRGVVAEFGIDLRRAPYFFSDRDFEPARDGRRKRIFHAVMEHDRIVHGTTIVRVRAHFRGARTFMWSGYAIHIVSPRNQWVFEMPVAAVECDGPITTAQGEMMDMREFGKVVVDLAEAS